MSNNKIVSLRVWGGEDDNFLFKNDCSYQIPLYQREYAWEEKQIRQLIEDIYDIADDAQYHIGSLIVARKGTRGKVFFEVIDGQQRMTSLFLLLKFLEAKKIGIEVPCNISFACRDKSNYSLECILQLIEGKNGYDEKRVDSGILRGVNIFRDELKSIKQKLLENKKDYKEDSFEKELLEKLKRVIIYRIEVPEHTDLNRYFEIMNTRGEQLEHTDILKAQLMSFLGNYADQSFFATIWDACSDMSGYVQMHFKDVAARDCIFGDKWNSFPSDKWEDYKAVVTSTPSAFISIKEILKPEFRIQTNDGMARKREKIDGEEKEVEKIVRFEGLIDFAYFLLHVLKVFSSEKYGLASEERLLDDKKLLDRFKEVYSREGSDKSLFSKNFALCLLRCRFLMDKYIVRREFIDGSNESDWSLQELRVSGENGNRSPYYAKTSLEKEEAINDELTMLQAALRVSYTSPKVMHWITEELMWLMKNEGTNFTLERFVKQTESIAVSAVKTLFFDKCIVDNQIAGNIQKYEMGVDTPHIVFNYLDYLLWKENPSKYKNFTFEFRNTVEHWYPQNPSEAMFDRWEKGDGVDRFGNLCLIQREINSLFSNNAPESKKGSFKKMIERGSIKLRKMSELTVEKDDKSGSLRWKESICAEHEKEMIEKLKKACSLLG